MDWKILLIAIVVAWVVRAVLTTFQVNNYRQQISSLIKNRKDGYIASGISSGWIHAGAIVLIIADKDGVITDAERMKGRTVFARFESFKELFGLNVNDLPGTLSDRGFDKNTNKALMKAIDLIEEKMKDQSAPLVGEVEDLGETSNSQ